MYNIEKLLEKINMEEAGIDNNHYVYQNQYSVPRVTEILSATIHQDFLMSWSNFIGRIKHQDYKKVLNDAANKGSYVHNAIENYIQNGIDLDLNTVETQYKTEVNYAYKSFKLWWEIISSQNVNVVMQEQQLVCPWFGGTLDLLTEINGRLYLLDFKTSNHASFKYFLQLAAYRYILKYFYGIEIYGCGIIKLEKKYVNFEEYIIDKQNEEYDEFMNLCEQTFLSLVYAYINRLKVEQFYDRLF